jgi:serine/threonine protein kinase
VSVKRLAAYGEPVEGTPFGRYRLVELLGRGGQGEVWRAYDTTTNNRMVAIKLLPLHLAHDDMYVLRFRREAEAAARLNNPHIIPIHTYGEIDGRLYVDMRLVEGRDLQQVLADGPLEPGRAVRIIAQVAKALHAAHKIGLVHRDVKPSNILLDEDDFAYLIDFGIARGADQTRLTGTGTMVGSWHYMAPERLRASEADARADIYALTCVLYECLTGTCPFPGDSMESQVAAHLTDPPPRPSTSRPTVPKQFDQVIATGMAKDPDNRYATTVQLADAAREAITVPIPRPTPSRAPNPPSEQARPTDSVAATGHVPSEPTPTEQTPSTDAGLGVTEQAERTTQPATQMAPTRPPAPPKEIRIRRMGRRTKIVLGAVALLIVVAVAVVTIVVANMSSGGGVASRIPTTSSASSSTTTAETSVLPPPPSTTVAPAGVITIDATGFSPNTVTVSPGAYICFVNNDSRGHAPIFPWQTRPTIFLGPHSGSHDLCFFPAPVEPGSYPYHDTLDPSLQGVLIVK